MFLALPAAAFLSSENRVLRFSITLMAIGTGELTNQLTNAEAADSSWKGLYKVGGAAALIVGALYIIEIVGVAATGVPPSTAIGMFTLLQNNRLLGLFDLFLLDAVAVAFMGPMFLALYVSLRRASQSFIALATALAFVGIADYYATNTAFSMLSLSNQYAAATTDAQRSILLTLGQQLLLVNLSTGAYVALTLIAVAGIIISAVMLRSHVFGRGIAYVGILGNILTLGPPDQFVPASFYQGIGVLLIGMGGVILVIWHFLIARRLYRFGRDVPKEERAKLKSPRATVGS
jgi:hypothetical protein